MQISHGPQRLNKKETACSPYSGHLGGSVEGADEADKHDAAKAGQDELVATLSEVDRGVGGGLCIYFIIEKRHGDRMLNHVQT